MAAYRVGPGEVPESHRGDLVLTFQEVLTITVRLRSRQMPMAESGDFRRQVKQLLYDADQRARDAQYPSAYVKLAVYATVAFLDESVLEGDRPLFPEWAGRPLQEEIFGDNVAGENFFRNIEELLEMPESDELADLMEVYLLCLLLGFRGVYSSRSGDALEELNHRIRRKIQRIRGDIPLSPSWKPPTDEVVPPRRDTRTRRLGRAAAILSLVAITMWVIYAIFLGRSVTRIASATVPSAPAVEVLS